MAGAEIANLKAAWINGALRIQEADTGNDVMVIGATTGMPFGSYYQKATTHAAAVSLDTDDCGKLVTCATDNVVFTLPTAAVAGVSYTIMNTASDGAAKIVVLTAATTDVILGLDCGVTTDVSLTNTKTTQRHGDSIGVMSSGSVSWFVTHSIGTWATASTS